MKHMKKWLVTGMLLCLLMMLKLTVCAADCSTEVTEIQKYGNLVLSISGTELLDQGYAYGDIVTVELNGTAYQMPVCTSYSDVDENSMVCRVSIDPATGENRVIVAINMGDLATKSGLAVKTKTAEEPGYRWDYQAGVQTPVLVRISMKEQGGYLNEYEIRHLTRSNERTDYAALTDAEFANFRPVTTTGIEAGSLYRSSSPVNPELARNAYADAAIRAAGVKTVLNLSDTLEGIKSYAGYQDTYYADCTKLALNLGIDFTAPDFKNGLAEGFRFLAKNSGPYLVHCNEGKDRAGFVNALLECLMGASGDEIVVDYMVTYHNYYGVEAGTEQYELIAESNIKKSLAHAFGIGDICAADVDLAAEAVDYMENELGLSEEEVIQLWANLSGNHL